MSRLESLMTVGEVAKYLVKSEQTIKKWVRDGDLKCSSIPKDELRFDPNYIRSLGEIKFKNGISSPEVHRLKKEIKNKDEEIEILKSDLYTLLSDLSILQSKASQLVIKVLNETN